jgi:hypothetical protein
MFLEPGTFLEECFWSLEHFQENGSGARNFFQGMILQPGRVSGQSSEAGDHCLEYIAGPRKGSGKMVVGIHISSNMFWTKGAEQVEDLILP